MARGQAGWARLLNPAVARLHRRLRYPRLPEFPTSLVIETTSRCNLRCRMCPRNHMARQAGDMEPRLFRRLIDEMAPWDARGHLRFVALHAFGEPLLNPNFLELAQYAGDHLPRLRELGRFRDPMQGLCVSTNATLLTPELAAGLLASPLTWIGISVDGASAETYAQMRQGGSLEHVMDRVRGLLELNAAQPREFPTLGLQIIVTALTRPELEQFAAQWQPYLDRSPNVRLEIKPYTDWAGQVECSDLRLPERRRGYFHVSCSFPQTTLTISADGAVLRCCHEVDPHLDLGEVNTQTIQDVWHGPGLQALREQMARGDMAGLDLCNQCEYGRKYPADYLRRRRRRPDG